MKDLSNVFVNIKTVSCIKDKQMASKHAYNSLDLIASGINNARALGSIEWIGMGMGSTLCFQKNGKTLGLDRMWTKCILSVGMVLLLMPSVLAADGKTYLVDDNLFE